MYDINNLSKQQLDYFTKRFAHIKLIDRPKDKLLRIILRNNNCLTIKLNDKKLVYITNYYSKTFVKTGIESNTLAQAINAGITTDIIQNG